MPRSAVMIVGGYGKVGGRICAQLSRETDLSVIVSGRRLAEAERLAASLGAGARHLDLSDPGTWEMACTGIDCVVACMDQKNSAFCEFLFDHAIDYIDITASDRFFRKIEALAPAQSTAMLSVGLAPGLTNILAAHCAACLDRVTHIDIGLLAGLGDHHGRAGLDWMADRLFDPARDRQRKVLDFGFGQGKRMAHCVDFSDQHALRRTLAIESVTTRICFNPWWATNALFAFADIFPASRRGRATMLWMTQHLRIGSLTCNLSVHALGERDGETAVAAAHFAGQIETEITAGLAAIQILQCVRRRPPAGHMAWPSDPRHPRVFERGGKSADRTTDHRARP